MPPVRREIIQLIAWMIGRQRGEGVEGA